MAKPGWPAPSMKMEKRSLLLAILSSILPLSLFLVPEISQAEIQILRVGEFHGDEVSANSGELWFGLYPTANGFELISSEITVEPVHDSIVDDEGTRTGKKVSVDQSTSPLFLVKGLEDIKDGPIETAFHGDEFLYLAQSMTLRLRNDYYLIQAFGEAVERNFETHITKNRTFGEQPV